MKSYEVVERCVFSPGDNVEGRYVVRKLLGEGSFGDVYEVADYNGTSYALKLLRLWDATPEIRQELCDRFRTEYETGRIDCQQIVHSFQYGKIKGNPYILMEFCPGGDLTSMLGQAGQRTVPICRDILMGLKAIHQHDKVHRDLKPENVLFKKDGTAALTDFGIVGDRNSRKTALNVFRKPKQIFGTYAYMPPEQANLAGKGATVKNTTDIFSFGVLAYQLLTDRLPFGPLESHNDVPEYLKRGKNGLWDRESLRYVEHGQRWAQLIDACLKSDYRERVQSVDEVLRMLPQQESRYQPQSASHYQSLQETRYQPPSAQRYQPQPSPQSYNRPRKAGSSLTVTRGSLQGQSFDLTALSRQRGGTLIAGRFPDCAIVLPSQAGYVSRHHCTFRLSDDGRHWLLHDGQWMMAERRWSASCNGTYVNGQPLARESHRLKSGDIIVVGDVTLQFESDAM